MHLVNTQNTLEITTHAGRNAIPSTIKAAAVQCFILPRSNTVQQPIEDVIIEFTAIAWKEMTRLKQAVLKQIMRKEYFKAEKLTRAET